MAGWSPCEEPVPFTRLLLGTVADISAPGRTQSRGFGEAAQAGYRAGGGQPVAAGADGSSAGHRASGEQPSRGETGTTGGGWGSAGGRGVGRGCSSPLCRGTGDERLGLGDFIPAQAVIQIHPILRAAVNVRGGIGRKEGGSSEQHPLSASPGLPSPGPAAAFPAPGYGHVWCSLELCVLGEARRGREKPSVQQLRAEREGCLWCALEAVSLRQIPACGNWKCSSGTVMPCADKSLHSARLLGSALCQRPPCSHKHTKPQKETQQIFPMALKMGFNIS
ncbi:circumsporozoite protein-like [Corvus cornix cornix]|uniref:circumsporozoite protein-like n=1 Tax=Corvus cornix cornix TaxID=932674 RepID=UPI00194DBE81|nr:circumsporozoite protein-like [Corvus cornix cornix]